MRLYLDLCVYNRPFDDQGQPRIALEANAFIYVLEMVEQHECALVASEAIVYENSRNPDEDRRERIRSYLRLANECIEMEDSDMGRANFLKGIGFSLMDALHIAIAERGEVDYFVTCDDDIVSNSERHRDIMKVRIVSLMEFVAKGGKEE